MTERLIFVVADKINYCDLGDGRTVLITLKSSVKCVNHFTSVVI